MNSAKRRLIAFLLFLSVLVSLLSVYSFAADSRVGESEGESTDALTVVYNRGFEEGWDYTNGLKNAVVGASKYAIEYTRLSPSFYDYYLKVTVGDSAADYLEIDAGDKISPEGKTFIAFDFFAEAGTDIVGAVNAYTAGEGAERSVVYLLSFSDGDIYLLGERVGEADGEWHHVGIEFDFGYAEGATDEYAVRAYYGDKTVSRTESADVFGISALRIGAAADAEASRAGQSYLLDDIQLYYGADNFTNIKSLGAGSAVDASLPRDFEVISGTGGGSTSGLLGGQPQLDRTDKLDGVEVLFNRHFGDGWDYTNGFPEYAIKNNLRNNIFELRYDYDYDINKSNNYANHYLYMEKAAQTHGFLFFGRGSGSGGELLSEGTGKLFFEFDMKTCANSDFDPIITSHFTTGGFGLMSTKGGKLILLGTEVGDVGEQWLHIAFEIDFDYGEREIGEGSEAVLFTAYYGDTTGSVSMVYEPNKAKGETNILNTFRMQMGYNGNSSHLGKWIAFDNIQLYYGGESFANIPSDNYGTLVDDELVKDFGTGTEGGVSISSIYDSSLTMKVGSYWSLLRGKQTALLTTADGKHFGEPVKIDGEVMVPLQPLLDFIGATVWYPDDEGQAFEIYFGGQHTRISLGSEVALIGGKRVKLTAPAAVVGSDDMKYIVIAMDDIETVFPGYYVTWDDMGLFTVSVHKNFIDRSMSGAVDTMVSVMRRFLFETATGEEIYNMALEKTGFDHPYLFADQAKFDELRAVYNSVPGDEEYDPLLISYIGDIIEQAMPLYTEYGRAKFDESGRYAGLASLPINTNYTTNPGGNGYDVGGRLNLIYQDSYTGLLDVFAFAVQMTRDYDMAAFLLDWVAAFCDEELWPHWGSAHFLNPSESSEKMAVAYDWCYDMWMEIDPDKCAAVAEGIYRNAIHHAYINCNNLPVEHRSLAWTSATGHCVRYNVTTNNWNQVCSAAMTMDILAIMPTLVSGTKAYEESLFVISDNLKNSIQHSMHLFAPDGSYAESSGYGDATIRTFYQMVAALVSTTGRDFGYMDTWAMDKYFYFALNIETPGYVGWPYHDDSLGELESQMLFFYAQQTGDHMLAEIRKLQQQNGKGTYLWDAIYYYKTDTAEDIKLDITYYMEGLDAFTVRSSWEADAMFAGIMGESNGGTLSHVQIDSGNWVYYNKGIFWFTDFGMEQYTAYQPSGINGDYMYRRTGEGHNVVVVTGSSDIPSGQLKNGNGVMTDHFTNEHGAYAIIDNTSAYGDICRTAERGMLVTNDYKTVVIQDKLMFNTMTSVAWIAHFQTGFSSWYGTVTGFEVDSSGKTAYLQGMNLDGEEYTLRVTLITGILGAKFEVWDAGQSDFALTKTYRPGENEALGGTKESSRDGYRRLVVTAKPRTEIELSVVIELIDPEDEVEVGYKKVDMHKWVPEADTREGGYVSEDAEQTVGTQRSKNAGNLYGYVDTLESYDTGDDFLGKNIEGVYMMLGNVQYLLDTYGRDYKQYTSATMLERIAAFDRYRAIYDGYVKNAVKGEAAASEMVGKLLGLK